MTSPVRIGVLGAGGLGKAAARIISKKRELCLAAVCDSRGIVSSAEGLDGTALAGVSGDLVAGCRRLEAARAGEGGGAVAVATDVEARHCDDPLGAMLAMSERLDAILIALPNLPNEFIPGVVERFAQAEVSLVFVDVLKRTRAVRQMLALDALVKRSRSVVMTGCGATPGLLAAAAVLAAQSFIEVEKVDIWWGVGIANWEAYKATIREDIAHLSGYTLERAKAMTDAEVEVLLERTNGLLELTHMEHADDLLLQRVGVVDRLDQVEVGGIMDTRHPKKPVSTTMTLTGTTADGKRAHHTFILGDETTMADNVIGPALGYLKRGLWLKAQGLFGVFGCTEFLPMVVR
ncbi:MAG: saccharopine dehydrogenase-like oxidoreductase [Candidatus Omnitrophica bacterium]|nr:saccharopine dehydrogenase-like oxidoreductase [Candidatus Omnitrophota bacterium]MBI3083929.1 saccharopine dehydrogenase-like oxidoreductase [Candidatus Omnitrophota bacterium]